MMGRLFRRQAQGSAPVSSGGAAERLRSLPWVVLVTAGTGLAALAVLLFLLLVVSHNQALYEHYYKTLFAINVAAGAVLLLVIVWVGWRLWMRLRRGKFGARLMLKLALTFSLVGLLPGLVIYVVSYQFVVRSIESWFDQRVEGALQAGLNLGVGTLDNLTQDLVTQTRAATADWTDVPLYGAGLERLREQLRADDVQVWGGQNHLLAASGASRFELAPQGPDAEVLQELVGHTYTTSIEGLDNVDAGELPQGRLHLWVRLRPRSLDLSQGRRILHVVQPLPAELMRNALQVQNAYREYQERALAREGLRSMYVGTLTLSLILAVFAAILLAVLLSSRLMRPLLLLSEGVAKVAAGDLKGQAATARLMRAGDELGDLTQSFAQMTQQLAGAQAQAQASLEALEQARTYLQTILDHQSSGVLVLDAQGEILSVNAGATRVLRQPLAAYVGRRLEDLPEMAAFAHKAQHLFAALADAQQGSGARGDYWEQTFVLHEDEEVLERGEDAGHGAHTQQTRTILARGVLLPLALTTEPSAAQMPTHQASREAKARVGQYLLVIDDISATVSAQRSQAWAEVARRLAHEIKNPLTPIQLSAERMQMKLEGKLQGAEAQLVEKSVGTIVDQVAALKHLVDEFREYARLPAAQLQEMNLNALLRDMAQLYAHAVVPVRWHVEEDLPAIMGDAQQLRQVVHNLVQNGQDAAQSRYEAQQVAGQEAVALPAVEVSVRLSRSGERLRLNIRDNGSGFPPHILQRAFEPYVTTKAKGTGLGLAVVKKIADEHQARIEISNLMPETPVQEGEAPEPGEPPASVMAAAPLGAQITLSFPLAQPAVGA